jgi:hypothetical protein
MSNTRKDIAKRLESAQPNAHPGVKAKFATPEQIKERYKQLRAMPKQRLFDIWTRETLGRIHNADIKEQDKLNMAVDLIRSEYERKDWEAAGFKIKSSRPGAKTRMKRPPLVWKAEPYTFNGKKYTNYSAPVQKGVTARIFNQDEGVYLVINGYKFEYDSVESAKAGAEDRIARNAEIYLNYYARTGAKVKMGIIDRIGRAATALTASPKDPSSAEYRTDLSGAKKAAQSELGNYKFLRDKAKAQQAALDSYVTNAIKTINSAASVRDVEHYLEQLKTAVRSQQMILSASKTPFSRPGAKVKMAEPLPTRPIGSGKNRYLIYHQAVAEEIEQIKQMRNGIIYLREQLSNAKSDMNGAIASFMKVKEFEDEAKAKAQFQNAENEFKQAKEKVQYYLKQVRFSRPGVKVK